MKMVSMIRPPLMIGYSWECMLDIIWNAVEDEYLTVIMYLLCSIPMRFSGKTSQMIHNGKAGFIQDEDGMESSQVLKNVGAQIVAHQIGVPGGAGEQTLYSVG